ncbi:hypothetical protein [Pseudomonas viridiflava]|uniref:hypothetical protein n=1 Tax=Pseudomonas viridiflava TaxID=33069 RepID=UPI000F01E229|nr:hypothetical protein [Pseudomonas viridiflava]
MAGRNAHKPKPKPLAKPKVDYAAICNNASGITVQQAFDRLGPITRFEDLLCPPAKLNGPTELASEQVFHMIEGWRYASAATSAFLNHSQQTALHFAYYAELRAALSLLSWSGIRVKLRGHYYLDGRGVKKPVDNSPTHTAVWSLWKNWVNRTDAQALFSDHIRLTTGVPLSEVVTALKYVKPTQTIQGWGLDLAKVNDDHSARNISSYEAYWMKAPLSKMKEEDLDLVLMLWKLLLPDDTGLAFDGSLISYFVKQAMPGMLSQQKLVENEQNISDTMEIIANEIGSNTGLDADHIARKLDPQQYDTLPFELASSSDTEPRNVLCRAFFLLRLSMLATKSSINLTTNASTSEWLSNWLEHAGLWDRSLGIDPYDISVDYGDAVDHFKATSTQPSDIWIGGNLANTVKLTRPDACMVWNVI